MKSPLPPISPVKTPMNPMKTPTGPINPMKTPTGPGPVNPTKSQGANPPKKSGGGQGPPPTVNPNDGPLPPPPRALPPPVQNTSGVAFTLQATDSSGSSISFSAQGLNGFFSSLTYSAPGVQPITFLHSINRVFEFTSSQAGYQYGVDQVVSQYLFTPPGPSGWLKPVVSNGTCGSGSIYNVTFQTADMIFKAVAHVVSQACTINGAYVFSSNNIKLDFFVNNYPYQKSGTKIAVESRINTGAPLVSVVGKQGAADPRVQVNTNGVGSSVVGAVTWVPWILADGNNVTVVQSSVSTPPPFMASSNPNPPMKTPAPGPLPSKTGPTPVTGPLDYRIFFTFNTVTPVKAFEWDPSVGAVSVTTAATTATTGSATIYSLSLVVVLISYLLQ